LLTKIILLIFNSLVRIVQFVCKPVQQVFRRYFEKLANNYALLLRLTLKNRVFMVIASIVFAVLVISIIPRIGIELVPEVAESEFTMEITHPQGTPISITDKSLQKIASSIADNPLVKHSYSLAGSGSLMMSTASKGGENWGQLSVAVNDSRDLHEIKNIVRLTADEMADVSAKISQSEMFTNESPLQIRLSGYDLILLKKYSDQLARELSSDQQFTDINNSLRDGQPELKISFDNQRLASLNLRASDIANKLVTKIAGSVASKYNLEDRQIDILVRANKNSRDSAQAIAQMTVNSEQQKSLPLSSVATIVESVGPNEINRIDQNRVAIVSASLVYGDLAEAAIKSEKIIKGLYLPSGISAIVTGQNEEMASSFSSLMMALSMAVFLVYLVMASQFESLLNPFIILFSVPLAILGSILGLYLTATNISVIVLIGMIMLSGIVVNNAIVLVDRINQLRQQGYDKIDAILAASESRFRPIIMTTLTTVLGLAPLAFGSGEGSELRTPLAITVMSGLLVATMLTLLLIPVLYSLFDRKVYKVQNQADLTESSDHEVNYDY
jgi:HAE1 family hydrophobic/amphiphilic exporter-1